MESATRREAARAAAMESVREGRMGSRRRVRMGGGRAPRDGVTAVTREDSGRGALSGAGVTGAVAAVSPEICADVVPVSGRGKVNGGRLSSAEGAGAAMPDDSLVTRPSSPRNVTNVMNATATVTAVTIAARP
jgi:hypothetical protein